MKTIEYYFQDPVIQFVVFVTAIILVYDGLKLILDWAWKKLGGDDEPR